MIHQQGIYTIQDAAALAGITPRRLRIWLNDRRHLIPGAYREAGIDDVLSYRDLLEARIIRVLRDRRFSLKRIADAVAALEKAYPGPYPLLSGKLQIEGHRFLHIDVDRKKSRRKRLEFLRPEIIENIQNHQLGLKGLIQTEDALVVAEQSLLTLTDVERDSQGDVGLWRPKEGKGKIILHPARFFGAPILEGAGVPTRVLRDAMGRFSDRDAVLRTYQVSGDDLDIALAFEAELEHRAA